MFDETYLPHLPDLCHRFPFSVKRVRYRVGTKIRADEQAGVVATRHVQEAARVVADENVLLRSLIIASLE